MTQLVGFPVNYRFIAETCKDALKSVWKLEETRTSVSGVAKVAAKLWKFRSRQEHLQRQTVSPSICRHRVAFHVLFALSADKASLILGVGKHVIIRRYIFEQLANFFVPLIDKLNGSLVLGGIGEDIELDEISFRSVGRRFGKFGSVSLLLSVEDPVWCGFIAYRTE